MGKDALWTNTTGNNNTAAGFQALVNNVTGSSNTALGYQSALGNISGSLNTFVGFMSNVGDTSLTNATAIGANAVVAISNALVLGNNVNVGIGTSSPAAKLDVEGAVKIADGTQGNGKVLVSDSVGNASWQNMGVPPGTAAGQMLYWDGSSWTNIAPGNSGNVFINCNGVPKWAPVQFQVGMTYGGGIIFYIDSTCVHGLIAATADVSYGEPWWNGSYVSTLAFGTAVGTGSSNTSTIIAAQGAGSYAAADAHAYNGGGYTDWYLPSLGELAILYQMRNLVGGFQNNSYWSSSEAGFYQAYNYDFYLGIQNFTGKGNSYPVRPIRSF
jgi:hypothetical protein